MAGSKKRITIASTEPQARKVLNEMMERKKKIESRKKAKKK